MAWVVRNEPWHRTDVRYCDVTGQLLPRRYWTFEYEGRRYDVMDERCDACQAAEDVAIELAQRATGEVVELVRALESLRQQQLAFITAVRDYNLDIADYAITLAPPDAGAELAVRGEHARRALCAAHHGRVDPAVAGVVAGYAGAAGSGRCRD